MNFDHDLSTIDVSGVTGQSLTISGNGALQLPLGLDASRPTASAGKFRWSTTNSKLEVAIDGTTWKQLQFWSTELDGVSALATTGLISRTASGTYTPRSIAQPAAGITVSNGDGVSGNPTLALANDLSALEGLSSTGIAVRTGADAWAQRSVATASSARITVSNGDGVAGNPTLDLATVTDSGSGTFKKVTVDTYGRVSGTAAVGSSDITTALGYTPLNQAGDTMTAGFLTLFQDPTSAMHAATKQYVDQRAAGLDPKGSVRAASAVNVTVSNPGTSSIGGVTLTSGDRVLLKSQTTGSENGIYIFNGSGAALTRATDANTSALVTSGMFMFVTEGTYAATGWILSTADPITLGTTSLTFVQFNGSTTYTASNGIALNANDIQTDSTSLLRGLHTLASNGIIAKTGSNTASARTITQPAAGITVSNGDGVSGNPTLALANDLAAVEGLAANGMAARTATDTWTVRTITGTANQISVSNGDGVSGNPTISIPNDPVLPGTTALTLPTGTNAQETGSTNGMIRFNSDVVAGGRLRQRFNAAWTNVGTGDGSVTSVGLSTTTDALVIGSTPVTTSGTITIALNAELQGLKTALVADTLGVLVQTASNTFAVRQVTNGTGISITNPKGIAGDITVTNTLATGTQSANTVFAGPTSGGAVAPTFRTLVYGDLPISLYKENPSTPTAPTAAGTNAASIGSGASAAANNSLGIGDGSATNTVGQKAFANGKFATAGDAQCGLYVLRNTTSNGTQTELFVDGSATRISMPNNSAFFVTVWLTARRTDATGGSAAHKHEFLITRDANAASTAIVGNVSKTVMAETNSTWDSTITADTTNGTFNVKVTGEAAKSIRWVAKVETVEVTN